MTHKDPEAAKACKRAYYLAHKDKWAKGSIRRNLKRKEESLAKKAAKAAEPKKQEIRFCVVCSIDITISYVPKHGPRCKACVAKYHRAYREVNSEKIAASKAAWKEANKAHVEAKDRAYALANPEKRTIARKKWAAANPGKNTAAKALNHQSRKQRVPTWLSDDDKWLIEQAYELSALRTRLFGFSWHVDHVIPLNGKKVSGLHVPTNLQVIPGVENLRKHNRFEAGHAEQV